MTIYVAIGYLLSSWAIGYVFGFQVKQVFDAVSAI